MLSFSVGVTLPDVLTHAERTIALLLLEGISDEEIARQRGVSKRTVTNQVASVFRKVGVRSRAELAARLWPVAE